MTDSPSPSPAGTPAPHGRVRAERSDSIRNRAAIVAAAQGIFARDGLEAPLERIAADAGIGIGTLYRHFPTRPELWQAVLAEPLAAVLELIERSLADPDPWHGFASYIRESCALEADSSGYVNLLTTRYEGAPELLKLRAAIQERIRDLFRRARATGAVRPDLTTEDLIFVTLANSRIVEVTRTTAPTAWKRNVELFLDSVRPERAHPLAEPPMTPSQVFRSIERAQRPRPGRLPKS